MPEYELTHVDERKIAVRLVRSAIEKSCKDTVLRQQLDDLDGVPCSTLTQEIHKAGLLLLMQISSTAEFVQYDSEGLELNRAPNWPVRLKALEILMNTRKWEAELLLQAQEAASNARAPAQAVRARVVTTDQLAQMEAELRSPTP